MINQKGFALIAITLLCAGMVIAGLGIWYKINKKEAAPTLDHFKSNETEHISSVDSASFSKPLPFLSSQQTASSSLLAGWEVHKDSDYKFEIQYPKFWRLSGNITEPYVSPTIGVVNFYTTRLLDPKSLHHPDVESIIISVAIYEKPSAPVKQWLSTAYETDLANSEPGEISNALARAYAGKTGALSYNEAQYMDGIIYEVGAVLVRGSLEYTTYIAKNDSKYVYALDIQLPFEKREEMVDIPDGSYTELYTQMLSTFMVIK